MFTMIAGDVEGHNTTLTVILQSHDVISKRE